MRRNSSLLAALVTLATALTIASTAGADTGWRLPWRAGQQVYVTQDCNDSCCSDHVGHNAYAWDFATYGAFDVVAPRAGTVTHVKMSSNRGGDSNEVDASNYIVIDHGDGTASVFLHLERGSLDPGIQCGAFVRQGQRLAVTGATGWASGNHLHFQVNRIPPTMNRTCECGGNGMACGEYESHWELFWSRDNASASIPVEFDDWHGSSQCNDRHDNVMVTSRNVDAGEPVIRVDTNAPGRFVPLRGEWSLANGGALGRYHAAASGTEAAALVPFNGSVARPGVYEVWTSLPAEARNTGAAVARAEVIARGERTSQMQRQTVAGGGFRPLTGRFKLTGREGEGVVMSSFAHAAESLAVDGVMLRRVGETGTAGAGAACRASTECAGDMVCAGGTCRAGCEQSACGAGEVCDATGLCLRGTTAATGENSLAIARDWDEGNAQAVRASTATNAASSNGAPVAPASATRGAARGPSARRSVTRPTGGGARDEATAATARANSARGPSAPTWIGGALFGVLAVIGAAGARKKR